MVKALFWIIVALLVVGYTQSPTFKEGVDDMIDKVKETLRGTTKEKNVGINTGQIIGNPTKTELGKIKREVELNCTLTDECILQYGAGAICEEGTCFKIS